MNYLQRMKEIELANKQVWEETLEFYNKQIEKYEGLCSFYYRMRDKAEFQIEASIIQLQYIDKEMMEEE